MLATLDPETARKVADDIRTYGHGYVRIELGGKATHVPSYSVVEVQRDERGEPRMHE